MTSQYSPKTQANRQEKKPIPSLPILATETRLEHAALHCHSLSQRPAVEVSTTRFYLIMSSMWIGNVTAYLNKRTVTTTQYSIGSEFRVNNPENMDWIATSYLLGFTVTQALLGKFSDIFGRSAVYNGTMLIFAAGSLWCSLAQSMNSLVVARLLQGIGASGRQTVGIIVIIDLTTPDTRGMWLGLFIVSLSAGVAIGPVLDATLSVHSTWRWLFWITLILSLVAFVIGIFNMNYPIPRLQSSINMTEEPKDVGSIGRLPAPCRKQRVGILTKLKEVDFIGSLLALAISSAICVAIEMGNKQFPWGSAPIISLFVVGLTLTPIFALYELKMAKNPVVDIHLFSTRNIPIACLINFTTGAAYFGAIFFLPRYFTDIKNSSLITAALQMLGVMFSLAVSTAFAANLISKTGQLRLVGFIGGVLYTVSSGVVLLIARNTPSVNVIGWSILMGFGSGIMYQPALVVGSMSVQPHQMAVISAFMGFLRTLGGIFATALLTTIFETRFKTVLRGQVPDELVNQGLRLADNHSKYPQYSDTVLDAMIKAYHDGSVPGIAMGLAYAICVACLQNIDFVPVRKRARIAANAQQG